MDDALKARLIGATVLVALAVLLIPELLSGRKPAGPDATQVEGAHGTRTFTIELGGPSQSSATTPPPAAARPAAPVPESASPPVPAGSIARADSTAAVPGSQPAPVESPASPPAPVKPPTGSAAPPSKAVEPPPTPAPKPAANGSADGPAPSAGSVPARGGWAVQVGAFGSADTADKLVAKLHAAGYKSFVSPVSRSGKALYRVRVGPVADRAAAVSLVDGLKAKGLPATVVAND